METDIANQFLRFDRKTERDPGHGRQEQQPKRPKRRSEANRFAPGNAAGQGEWSRKEQHQGAPQPQRQRHETELANHRFGAVRFVQTMTSSLRSAPSHGRVNHHTRPRAANKAFGTNTPFGGAKEGEWGTKPMLICDLRSIRGGTDVGLVNRKTYYNHGRH